MADEHQPVLLEAALAALAVRPDGTYIDATFGRGGHTAAMLDRLGPAGRVIAFDQDPDAERHARALAAADERLVFVRASFADMADVLAQHDIRDVDGVLFDLGVSSPQFDVAERGFSFRHAGPLDMRMNPDAGAPLSEWLATASHGEIARVIKTLGEEPMAGRIAGAILEAREAGRLTDTAALAALIKSAIPARVAAGKRVHPATRTFQAFRMHINDELGALDAGLAAGLSALAPGGRLVVISFHSLEDRRVKRFFRHQARPPQPELPMAPAVEPALRLIGKPVTASESELAANPRARSAIMRAAERTTAEEVAP
ncbi:16S rRNA (cytosine(1402)-N(4))-methyltransferase RsmH [Salinisphaera hydrothermalis]|uniref:Ribosomal RNA small subunit methyltransferase H n=1 Tax=Salinisphaera hydrothermalis (strain C41B8) TaxID=1304275 RepID=A0A084IP77_SALHC|nr:16S rRNA (cytosine(1402)-N(4))-methyltransferase RsmH [Salinisphaera hydrothermalis]KEZ78511.1 16S rRNA m(4)C1402 methyltransferase [Salinisphaera hydrothermalis C41B8]